MAGGAAERLVHRGEQRADGFAAGLADRDHGTGEGERVVLLFHEGALAELHVEHERVDALGEFLAHDAGADERDALDGAGDIAERVELLVGGHDLRRLADHGAADLLQDGAELGHAEVDLEARDGLELVERAAGVAETAAAHHRDLEAAGYGERGEDERDLVADAAGGVLVDLGAGQVAQVNDVAGAHHRVGEPRRLLRGHAAPEDGHEQRRRLVVGE